MSMKTANRIVETKNYSLFRGHKINRCATAKKQLVQSMKENGFLDSNPIHAVKNGKGYVIKQGHHRFIAAQEAGVPIKVVITADDGKLPQEYIPERRWSNTDILKAYADNGKKDYIYIKKFLKNYPMPVTSAIMLLSGHSLCDGGASGDSVKKFQIGLFKVNDYSGAERVGQLINFCHNYIKFAKRQSFISAISRVVRVDEFDDERFTKKVKSHHGMIQERPRYKEFIYEIEKVYNYRVSANNKVALAVHLT